MLNNRVYRNDIYGAETIKTESDIYNIILSGLEEIVKEGYDKIILYPMCKNTEIAENILLNYFGKKVDCIADYYYSNYNKSIIDLQELTIKICQDNTVVVITSNDREHYDEVRKKVYSIISSSQIVDLFEIKPLYKKDSRLISLELASREIYKNGVAGSVAEVGVYRGYFAEYINEFFYDRKFYLFDTFSGFDNRDIEIEQKNHYSHFTSGELFMDTDISIVLDKMRYKDNCRFIKGYFPDSAINLPEETFCFVHLDTDLYAPILAGLRYFYPKLSAGGYIFIHDFNGLTCKGVRRAVKEFCDEVGIGYVCLPDSIEKGTAVITKGRCN